MARTACNNSLATWDWKSQNKQQYKDVQRCTKHMHQNTLHHLDTGKYDRHRRPLET